MGPCASAANAAKHAKTLRPAPSFGYWPSRCQSTSAAAARGNALGDIEAGVVVRMVR